MAEAPRRAAVRIARVACPDCGVEFDRRGLAAHRRIRHAHRVAEDPNTGEPVVASPACAHEVSNVTAPAPAASDVPSWNDVTERYARVESAARVSPSFRWIAGGDAASEALRPLLPGHVLDAARSTAREIQGSGGTSAISAAFGASPTSPTTAVSAMSAVTAASGASNATTDGGGQVAPRSAYGFADAPPSDMALLCRSIDVLTDAVRRLDRHLDRLLEVQSQSGRPLEGDDDPDGTGDLPPPLSSVTSRDDRDTLERDLDSVLNEIAQVRGEGAPHAELARLRRRQADVLARLLALDNRDDVAINLRLVSAESGPARRRRLA